MQLTQVSTTGKSSKITVSDVLFEAKPNHKLLAQAIRVYLSNARQGTSDTKTRAEVSRTTKKWFKQKGTGNARHGSRKAPIFVGGGVAHGPKSNQNWSLSMNTKAKQKALVTALTLQVEKIVINDEVLGLEGKTAVAAQLLADIKVTEQRILIIVDRADPKVLRSLRNLPTVIVQRANRITALEIAQAQRIILTTDALKVLETRIGGTK